MPLVNRHPAAATLPVAALFGLPGCPGLMQTPTTIQTSHGEAKALLGESDSFPRFVVGDETTPLRDAEADDDDDLLVLRRGEHARALLVDQMAFHHVAQGTLGDEP